MTAPTDLIVIGSGAAGLAAAVTAAHLKLSVTVLEKTDVLGGTSAWSGGWIWCPGNPHATRAGLTDTHDAPRRYLAALLGNFYTPERVEAFLESAPDMITFFERYTALQFDGGFPIPDTYGHLPGAGTGGRSVIAKPFDGRALGPALRLLRRPLRETSFHGMTIQAGADLRAFMSMTRSFYAFTHVTARILRHLRDLALHGRGTDLRNGNALIARLMRSALDCGVTLHTNTTVSHLALDPSGAITGVTLDDGRTLPARAVLIATGGFSQNPDWRAQYFPHAPQHHSLAVPSATGSGAALALAAGAALDTHQDQPAALCPVSLVPYPNHPPAPFPHIIERGKPGIIGVLASGKRFCNEGLGYHDYVTALLAATPEGQEARSWLICDHRFLRRYGLGMVRPAPLPWKPLARIGYLKTATTLPALAALCGIDPAGLTATLTQWNRTAQHGEDPEFGRGTTAYMRLQGDAEHRPNPCVAPLTKPPYFAVEVIPGSFGTFCGLRADGHARALRADGSVIPGLYVAGADAASPFGGFYPAGGINLGPALTFGYRAAHHLAKQPRPT